MFICNQSDLFKRQILKGFFALLIGLTLTDFVFARIVKQPQQKKTASAFAKEPPRKDLYRKITEITGVSLKQLSDLVFQKGNAQQNKKALTRLSRWSNKKEPQGIINRIYPERIQSVQKFCDQNAHKIPGCHLQIEDLKKEQSNLKALTKKAKTDKKLALYYYLVVFNHTLKDTVFNKAYNRFTKICPEAKINTEPCMAKRMSILHVYDIVNKLEQVALAKTRSEDTKEIAKSINQSIAVYTH